MASPNRVKGIEELPEKYLRLLYEHRLYEDRAVPYEDYKKLYRCVEADGRLYCSEEEKWRVKYWLMERVMHTQIVDAAIATGFIIKNRFGDRDGHII